MNGRRDQDGVIELWFRRLGPLEGDPQSLFQGLNPGYAGLGQDRLVLLLQLLVQRLDDILVAPVIRLSSISTTVILLPRA